MKTYLIQAVALVLLMLSPACGKKAATNADSTTVAAEQQPDSLFTTPDLIWHQLRGPVAYCVTLETAALTKGTASGYDSAAEGATVDSVTFSRQGLMLTQTTTRRFGGIDHLALKVVLEYDSEGNLLSGSDSSTQPPLKADIVRNPFGEPTDYVVCLPDGSFNSESAFRIALSWGDGRLLSSELKADELVEKRRFSYDGMSFYPSSVKLESEDIEESVAGEETYVYTSFDEMGNWIERHVTVKTRGKRYDVDSEPDAAGQQEVVAHRIDRRRITYHSR